MGSLTGSTGSISSSRPTSLPDPTMCEEEPTEEEFMKLFIEADKDGSGKLRAAELKNLLSKFAEKYAPGCNVNSMVVAVRGMCDEDNDKELNYKELCPFIVGKDADEDGNEDGVPNLGFGWQWIRL